MIKQRLNIKYNYQVKIKHRHQALSQTSKQQRKQELRSINNRLNLLHSYLGQNKQSGRNNRTMQVLQVLPVSSGEGNSFSTCVDRLSDSGNARMCNNW